MNIHDIISEHKHELIAMIIGCVITTIVIVFIIGWKRINWFMREYIKMYSANEISWFSKKRLESGQGFQFAFIMTCIYFIVKLPTMDIWDFGYILTVWLFIGGYTVREIQKEKKMNMDNDNNNGTGDNPNNTNTDEKK